MKTEAEEVARGQATQGLGAMKVGSPEVGTEGGPKTAASAVSSTSQRTSSYRRVLPLLLFVVSLPSLACTFFRP